MPKGMMLKGTTMKSMMPKDKTLKGMMLKDVMLKDVTMKGTKLKGATMKRSHGKAPQRLALQGPALSESGKRDSNPRPPAWKAGALAN